VGQRVRLDLEYDGTEFSGWQLQPGRNTVQASVESAFRVLYGRTVRVAGSGRTDAGVHALGQVAHANLPDLRYPLPRLCHSLNALTPDSVVVHSVRAVAPTFDARRSALWRLYRYRLSTRRVACGRQYVWWPGERLSFALLQASAKSLPGLHDFTSFCVAKSAVRGASCRIEAARWLRRRGEWHFEVRGHRFVHGMVRSLVGSMVAVAAGRARLEDFEVLLSSPSRRGAAAPAPACGLTLVKVAYED